MPVLLLTEDDVRQLLTMEMALEAVEDGLRRMALDEAVNVPRARTQTDHVMQHVLSYVPARGCDRLCRDPNQINRRIPCRSIPLRR